MGATLRTSSVTQWYHLRATQIFYQPSSRHNLRVDRGCLFVIPARAARSVIYRKKNREDDLLQALV
jgi:hypothetical protein